MKTPNYFLCSDKLTPFRLTRRGREILAERFGRQGINVDSLTTLDNWEEAIAIVINTEYAGLPAEQRSEQLINRIFDLQFLTYPLYGLPPTDLMVARGQRRQAMREITRQLRCTRHRARRPTPWWLRLRNWFTEWLGSA
ncbi:MAG: hypothetical protein KDK04_00330 [Candidatus Competibacteraceae bacterium]|nr:hypothetical protein [Candidatus Competibacteraceae bacterium]MCB1803743.1 hypothetical protein [Candidatus Competibacteraceae bacterium]MCB1810160.1 hypothetical protein [Candidatus Competibacteraceae bacterium]